jgi:hypothetical protein
MPKVVTTAIFYYNTNIKEMEFALDMLIISVRFPKPGGNYGERKLI